MQTNCKRMLTGDGARPGTREPTCRARVRERTHRRSARMHARRAPTTARELVPCGSTLRKPNIPQRRRRARAACESARIHALRIRSTRRRVCLDARAACASTRRCDPHACLYTRSAPATRGRGGRGGGVAEGGRKRGKYCKWAYDGMRYSFMPCAKFSGFAS